MNSIDIVPVAVVLNDTEREVYSDILESCRLPEPVVIDVASRLENNTITPEVKFSVAEEVSRIVDGNKSVVIGLKHYNMALCHNDGKTTSLIFDAHCDSYIDVANRNLGFGDGNFLTRRKGNVYILGTRIKSNIERIKTYPPRKVRDVLEALDAEKPEKVLLSLEIDVFNKNVTRAHHYPRRFEGISFEKAMDLSEEMVRGRNLIDINLAGYDPRMEDKCYRTADLLKDYLSGMIPYIVNGKV